MSLSEEENDDIMSSQLDENMLSEIEKEAEQGRTNQATAWAWNKLDVWLKKRQIT